MLDNLDIAQTADLLRELQQEKVQVQADLSTVNLRLNNMNWHDKRRRGIAKARAVLVRQDSEISVRMVEVKAHLKQLRTAAGQVGDALCRRIAYAAKRLCDDDSDTNWRRLETLLAQLEEAEPGVFVSPAADAPSVNQASPPPA